jgi:hypothetical protein
MVAVLGPYEALPYYIHTYKVGAIRRMLEDFPLLLYKYNTRTYWVLGLYTSFGFLINTMFRKVDLFPFSGDGIGGIYSGGSMTQN